MSELGDLDLYAHLLDMEQLEMLVEAGGDDSSSLINEILGLFETESIEKLGEIRDFVTRSSFDQLSKAAHALAGSSANIGGSELARQAKEIEDLCKKERGAEAIELIEPLESTYRDTIRALKLFSQ